MDQLDIRRTQLVSDMLTASNAITDAKENGTLSPAHLIDANGIVREFLELLEAEADMQIQLYESGSGTVN